MASFFREGGRISFKGFKGTITQITETYRKNVLVVKISEFPKHYRDSKSIAFIGLFEYPDGTIEFMAVID